MGGLPDRKQILQCVSIPQQIRESYSLFVQHIRYPEHALSLLDFGAVEIEIRTFLVQSNAVRESHSCCNEKVGWLGVRCP